MYQHKFPLTELRTHPRTPSIPWKPDEDEATPIDWFLTTRVGLSVTVSKNSLPEAEGIGLAQMMFVERNPPQNDPDPDVTHWQTGIC